MARRDPLGSYKRKRNLRRTPEPPGGRRRKGARREPIFVIQKHDARSLHYDFRLEADGVLRSWALPKGPTTDPREKRLAMPTEDHPIDYAEFEGVIPAGEYGAGSVIVWDTGTFRNLTRRAGEEVAIGDALDEGHALIWLEGHKIRGGYVLQRTGGGRRERWLLIKRRDEGADARRRPLNTEPRSVLSGRTIEEVAAAAERP
jgi:DNA ligase D-like protein (predicted 3'-phosphoesterase)